MVKSMTGYGRSEQTINGRSITIELKSVNNRYLDCNVRLPRAYGYIEENIKKKVRQSASRGKVDVYISVDSTQSDSVAVTVNQPLAASYLAAMQLLADTYGLNNDVTVSMLSRFPDVLTLEKLPQDQDALAAEVYTVLDEALSEYDNTRIIEGEKLKTDMLAKLDNLEHFVEIVAQRSPETVREHRERLYAKLQEVLENTQLDDSRILTEAAIFADKVAVDEEIVRLRSHIDRYRTMLIEGGIVGRQIDFLIQEMNRETNTIGSKCTDLSIAHVVVDMKSEIEKLREQVQNLE